MVQLSKTKVYDLVAKTEIEHVRITQSALEAWLAKNTQQPVR